MADREGITPIAIIGMSGKFPGEALNLDKLWDMCSQGRDAWSPVPPSRFNSEAFYHPDPSRNGASNVKGGFFLKEDLARFDAPFFGFTKTEAASLDPEQRMLLECAYETFENAGMKLEQVSGSNVGVYIGTFLNDWSEITKRDPDNVAMYQPTGGGHSMLAGRLAYFFNLHGPAMTMDTACSASLVALHSACHALRNGDCTSALVGGVTSLLNHEFFNTMSSMRFLSPDGRSFAYEDRANGYARGEGVACVLLKTLDAALRDGDPIRAIIRNTGLNNDGRTPGITFPSGEAQANLIRRVYEQVGLDPNDTTYVETHGTGTQAGDPVEARALFEAFGKTRETPLIAGSIKSNIGHIEGASGVTSLVKVVMMLEREMILPNANFTKPSKRIPLSEWKLEVPTVLKQWKGTSVLRASINNFGYAGTNAHIVVEQAKGYLSQRALLKFASPTNGINTVSPGMKLFVLSAFDQFSAAKQVEALATYLDRDATVSLDSLASTLSQYRSRLPWKTMAIASSKEELAKALSTSKHHQSPRTPSVAFVFTGQGAQWYAMGRELITIPAFRQSLMRSDETLKLLGASWTTIEELSRNAEESRVNQAEMSQPLCTILQLALVDLLVSWGIMPTAVVGHSSGELAAAFAAGYATQQNVVAAAYHRGIVSSLSNHGHACKGAMLAVPAPADKVSELLSRVKHGKAAIACFNSPSSHTISGDETAIKELLELCEAENISARKLVVDVGYHSYRMSSVSGKYVADIEGSPTTSQTHRLETSCDMFSSVTGSRIHAADISPQYWADNLTYPVRFTDAVTALCTESTKAKARRAGQTASIDILIEIGPHSALQGPIRQILQSQPRLSKISYLTALVRKQSALSTILSLAGGLYEKGYHIDVTAVNNRNSPSSAPTKPRQLLTDLPPYPWNHETGYWAEPRANIEYRTRKHARHDLLGAPVLFGNDLEPRWRNWLRTSELPWVRDHRVQGLVVYPAAGYLCMAIEAVRQVHATQSVEAEVGGYAFREVRIGQALVIPEGVEGVETMFTLRPRAESFRDTSTTWSEWTVYSASEAGTWSEHARGLVSVRKKEGPNEIRGVVSEQEDRVWHADFRKKIDDSCTKGIDMAQLYQQFTSLGLEYGTTFANINSARSSESERASVGTIVIPDVNEVMPAKYHSPFVVHPGTLDATFQAALQMVLGMGIAGAMVPTFIQEAYVSNSISHTPGNQLAVYSRIDSLQVKHVSTSMHVYDHQTTADDPVASFTGLTMTSLSGSTGSDFGKTVANKYFQVDWRPDPALITNKQFKAMCQGLRLEGLDDETLSLFDQATFYMADQALSMVSQEALTKLKAKSQNLYASMKGVRDGVISGERGDKTWADASQSERNAFWDRLADVGGHEAGLHLTLRENMHPIILEEVDPLTVAFKDDVLGKYYATNVRMGTQYLQAAAYVDLLANKNPHLKILEIGAGTGGATMPVLRSLGGHDGSLPRFVQYDITDITTGFFEKLGQKTAPWGGLVKFSKLDIERDPAEQGFELDSYDLIIAANVLHATPDMSRTMTNVQTLLKPGGNLVLIELMKDARICTKIFGIFDGWWAGQEPDRADGPLMTEDGWDSVLKNTGYTGVDLAVWDLASPEVHQGTTMISTKRSPNDNQAIANPLIVAAAADDQGIATALAQTLQADLVHMDSTQLPEQPCIVVSELDGASVLKDPTENQLLAIKRILLERNHILWVTRGVTANPNLNMISGLLATLRLEHGGTLAHLDLDPTTDLSHEETSRLLAHHYRHLMSASPDGERDLDFKTTPNGTICIPRYIPDETTTHTVSSITSTLVPTLQPIIQQDRPLQLKIEKPGLLDTLYFADDARVAAPPGPGELDIRVEATALNFRDVMTAMGQIEHFNLGTECAGTVSRVGPGVTGVAVGDAVVAQAAGTFATLVRAREGMTVKIPREMTVEAATLPIVYTTAVYACRVARLRAGETVLIHSAAGGLGQALVMLCRHHGADVYVTVGTPEKKRFVMDEYGIPPERIFGSRDVGFAKGLMRATGAKGIDVIFNSLSGDLLRATWQCTAPFGRFIELGKRDMAVNSRLEMGKFLKNISFTAVDLGGLIDERPEEASQMFREAIQLVVDGKVHAPKPVAVYGMDEVENVMRIMQSGKHMGKLVLAPRKEGQFKVLPKKDQRASFHSDATYLLVGGLGGIGRAWAAHMIQLGARNLLFMSPNGAKSDAAKVAVEKLEALGALVRVCACDVANREQLSNALSSVSDMPPIKGVFHFGANFKSDLFQNMSLDTWTAGVRPKVHSTWNLHELLPTDLDFFVLVASMAGVLGNTSQAAYSAASSFQDAFAAYRNNLGLAAVSIDLGVVAGVGHLAEHTGGLMDALQKNLQAQGVAPVEEAECMALLESAIIYPLRPGRAAHVLSGLSKLAAGELTPANMVRTGPTSHLRRAGLRSDGGTQEGGVAMVRVRDLLRKATSMSEVDAHIVSAMAVKMSGLLMVPVEEIDATKPMSQQGLDSLVAVELRNWISSDMEVTVPVLELLGNESLGQLCKNIARQSRLVRKELYKENTVPE